MNKKFILKTYPQHFWHVADLEVYESGKLVETIWVNKFYSLTDTWFFIYDEIGGSGTGFRQGDIIRKIYIGDAEFERK